ncbi:hypothetical protein [Nitrosophilus alvini]|uniref:hypothetical protein n=1 Tax=Nitrosophilus alvini TaxID=2714855 RepID=UPI00190A06A6|nr:hypothetical protein [Nitrosophilus alvini]
MIDKKVLILETIIKEYIKNPAPVSSKQLQTKLEIKLSSATIRNYFKKMVEEGKLEQKHISSGRVPTVSTLKKYWTKKLLNIGPVKISKKENIKDAVKNYRIFCEFKFFESDKLLEVNNIDNKFLLLVFERKEFVTPYTDVLYRFFNEFKGTDFSDLIRVCEQLGLTALSKKLSILSNEGIIREGFEELISIISNNSKWGSGFLKDIMEGNYFDKVEKGVHFKHIVPEGYLALKSDAQIEDKEAKMLCIGHLSRDFESFLQQMQKE